MDAQALAVNRYVAEQALLQARRYGMKFDMERARKVLVAIDKRKGIRRWQKLAAAPTRSDHR